MPPLRSTIRPLRFRGPAAAASLLLATACVDDSPLYEIPSVEGVTAAPEYAEAVDSARAYARRQIKEAYMAGASIAVGKGGEVVWSEAFGWADLSHQQQATPETLYPVGSISKAMTAAAAGVLWEQGKLDFEAPIQTYLPAFPDKRWEFNLRQLMSHTAGVKRSYGFSRILRQGECVDAVSATPAVAEDTLLYEPGTDFTYSNFGYRLVGAAVESAAGEPFLDFIDREVFDKVGMVSTVPDLDDEGDDESTKYDRAAFRSLRRTHGMDMSCSMAPGGFLSTPDELVRFGYAMRRYEVLDSATVEMFWTPQRLTTGESTGYGFGWYRENIRVGNDERATTPSIQHGGSVMGGRAILIILPEHDIVVAAQTNSGNSVNGFAYSVAGWFRDPPPPPSDGVGTSEQEGADGDGDAEDASRQ